MYEVEVKLEADHGPVRERLETAGATQQGTVTQTDTYYDHPARSFAARDEALRIRETDSGDAETATITYKGPVVGEGAKSREELEATLEAHEELGQILERLGFAPAATVRKERERWHLGDVTIVLDRVDGLGTYVEAETTATEEELEAARRTVREHLERLGLDPADRIGESYLEMLL